MTEAVLGKLKDAFTYGFTDREACLYAGINPSSLYDYCNENPSFSEQKEILKISPRIHAKRTIVEALQRKDKAMATWYAVHKMGDEFAPKSKVEHSGGVESTTNPEQARSAAQDALRDRYEVELRESLVKGRKTSAPGNLPANAVLLGIGVPTIGERMTHQSGHLGVSG